MEENANGKHQRLNDQERRLKHLEKDLKSTYELLLRVHNNIQGDSESGVRGLGNRVKDLEDRTHKHDKWIYKQKVIAWIIGGIITTGLTILLKSGVL